MQGMECIFIVGINLLHSWKNLLFCIVATSSMEAANPTEVAASPNEAGRNRLLSLLELKLPPLRFKAATPHPSNHSF